MKTRSACALSGMLSFLVLVSGCTDAVGIFTDPGTVPDTSLVTEARDWMLVFLFLDRNDLIGVADRDIAAIEAFSDPFGRSHRIILRDSTYDGSSIVLAHSGGSRTIQLSGLPAGSLMEGTTTAEVVRTLRREFPARHRALFLVGHGRGWQGIGYADSGAPTPVNLLTATEIREITAAGIDESQATGDAVLILDAGWSGFAEILYDLREMPLHVVAPTGNLHRDGLDYRALLETVGSGDWSTESLVSAAEAGLTTAAGGEPPVSLGPTELQSLGPAVDAVVAAGRSATGSAPQQERIRSHLMDRAVAASTPGDVHISMADLLSEPSIAVEVTPDPVFHHLLFHLVSVDELGLPSGHAKAYRVPDGSDPGPEFLRLAGWAPDFFRRSGFLYELWYREY